MSGVERGQCLIQLLHHAPLGSNASSVPLVVVGGGLGLPIA